MSEFHQQGIISTLHALYHVIDRERYLKSLEDKLDIYARQYRICLLLPSLYEEVEAGDVLGRIIEEIRQVRYISTVVVVLGGTRDEAEFKRAREFYGRLSQPDRDVKVLWILGPRIQRILQELQRREISTGMEGKGQSVWVGFGYIFARRDCEIIALHDCDIVTYDRVLLARLIEPVVNPHKDFEFCKGYYARISPSERVMKGRVTRLFIVPFVDMMAKRMDERGMCRLAKYFLYQKAFKYPLAGEFSLTSRLARGINISDDWGLEVSTLSEIYHRVILGKIAQVDLACIYEHKHQMLSPGDRKLGLHRMVVDIARFYFNYLRSHGVCLRDDVVKTIQETYYQNALRFVKIYADDAETNRLHFDRHDEELTVRYFREFLWEAWEESEANPGESLIPSWNRVIYSLPDIYSQLVKAVEADNR